MGRMFLEPVVESCRCGLTESMNLEPERRPLLDVVVVGQMRDPSSVPAASGLTLATAPTNLTIRIHDPRHGRSMHNPRDGALYVPSIGGN
jgi:hypothetical protein